MNRPSTFSRLQSLSRTRLLSQPNPPANHIQHNNDETAAIRALFEPTQGGGDTAGWEVVDNVGGPPWHFNENTQRNRTRSARESATLSSLNS